MARRQRGEEAGAVFHVTDRGVRRTPIFLADADRRLWLRFLARTVHEFDWQCLAYCLMDNHYHLLVRTPEPNLGLGMQRLNAPYAQAFNRRHGTRGHVFEDRFHSERITRETHLLEAVRYVVRNPVRARICGDPVDWPWSSHAAVLGLDPRPLVDPTPVLGYFGTAGGDPLERYADFVTSEPRGGRRRSR